MKIQGVTIGYRGYKRLQWVTGGYKGLQRVTESFFYIERFQKLFLGLFCITIKAEGISIF